MKELTPQDWKVIEKARKLIDSRHTYRRKRYGSVKGSGVLAVDIYNLYQNYYEEKRRRAG